MQPFPVICETCRARLKIRDESVIGEIHACPRCGAMVHIIPPGDCSSDSPVEAPAAPIATPVPTPPAPTGVAARDSTPGEAVTPGDGVNLGDISTPDEATDASRVAHQSVDSVTTPPDGSYSADVLTPPSTPTGPDLDEMLQSVSTEAVTPPEAESTSDLDPLGAGGAQARPTLVARALAQPILLWGGIGAVVLFVSGFSTALWLTRDLSDAATERVTQAPPSSSAAEIAPSEAHFATEGEQSPNQDDTQSSSSSAPDRQARPPIEPPVHHVARPVDRDLPGSDGKPGDGRADHSNDAPRSKAEEANLIASQVALPELPPDEPRRVTDDQLASEGTSEPGPKRETTGVAHTPVMRFDPLNFDPLALGLSTPPALEEATPTESVVDRGEADSSLASSTENENLPSDEELFEPPDNSTITVERGPAPIADLPAVDVDAQLALAIDSIDLPEVALASFLNIVGDLADVPVTLEPDALAMAGVSSRQKIVVRARNTTLEKLLRTTLQKHRLDFTASDGQIRVVRPGVDQRRSVNYEVKDLLSTGSRSGQASEIGALLQRFVAPATWQSAGGKGAIEVEGTQLVIEQTHGVHYQTLIFLERLRLARALPRRSKYPVELLAVEPPYAKLSRTLDETTTFTFLPWTPLSEIIQHWEEASGLTILVDWRALGDAGLLPSSPISCSAIERRWEDAISAVLDELHLAWQSIDDQTIQITTEDRGASRQQIEFYSLSTEFREQFSSDDALIDTLDTEIRETFPPRIGAAPARLTIDEASARLIVLANDVAHRYLTQRLTGGIVSDHIATARAGDEAPRVSAQPLP